MNLARIRPSSVRLAALTLLAVAATAALAPTAQARNVRRMESLADTLHASKAHEILGDLDLRFGGSTAQGTDIVRHDVVVTGTGATRLDEIGQDDRIRPSDADLCVRAFEDAITQLAFSARAAHATGIVGVVSDYEDNVFDDPDHYECHAGSLKAYVTLRAQLARGTAAPVPVVSPPPAPVVAPAPAVVSPPPPPSGDDGPHFQPLPPVPAPAPSN
ncbi:MAG: hypothetical protein ACTHL8_20350 [Burkholderiaceae bacterium]